MRFKEEEIMSVVLGSEAGAMTVDPARKREMSEAALCNWEAK